MGRPVEDSFRRFKRDRPVAGYRRRRRDNGPTGLGSVLTPGRPMTDGRGGVRPLNRFPRDDQARR